MGEVVRNRVDPGELTEADVDAAVARMASRDAERGDDARHVYDTLTWGEGPAQFAQSGLQDWLWYRLPTKYLTDEPGYMGRLAGVAAELFDELGLDGYAAVCRSAATAEVHDAFERSDREGSSAMRKARAASGIDPPDTDDFVWGDVMGTEEALARSAAEDALERAIADGCLLVGGRGWRARQREVTVEVLDAAHPSQPGQTWRTAIVTERLATWVDEASRRSPGTLASLRAGIANRLLHSVAPPSDVAERLAPLCWLLEVFGDEQALTQAGYLNTAFVRRVHADPPWDDPFASDAPPRTETDAIVLHRLRAFAETIGALRHRRGRLRRTARGAGIATDPRAGWDALTGRIAGTGWDRFVAETIALVLVDADDPMPVSQVTAMVAEAAAEMGWRTQRGQDRDIPGERDVSWAFADTRALLELFGMLDEHGDWRDRRWALTSAGRATMLAILRSEAAGPRSRPW